jgi:replicative DNA helicase
LTTDTPPESVLLCEGEKDAILAIQSGFANAVGMTGGAGTLSERWYTLLERIPRIYVAYDGDGAGETGTDKLVRRLGAHRVRIVSIPSGMDVADVVKAFGPEDLLRRIQEAHEPRIKAVDKYADVLRQSILEEETKSIPTPYSSLNRLLGGGVEPGHLITVTAPPKIGKTSFTLTWASYWASILDIPTLYWCVEMTSKKLAQYLVSIQFGVGRKPTKAQQFSALRQLDNSNMYLGFESKATPESLIQTFSDCYHRFGIGAFFFDNIHYMVRSHTGGTEKALAIENMVKEFKTFAIEYKVPVVIIAQPTKTDMKKGANLDYTGIGWSGAFASDSDAIIILHRDRVADTGEAFKPQMMVKVDASRESSGGVTFLQMYEHSLQFKEMSRNETMCLIGNRK